MGRADVNAGWQSELFELKMPNLKPGYLQLLVSFNRVIGQDLRWGSVWISERSTCVAGAVFPRLNLLIPRNLEASPPPSQRKHLLSAC